MRIRNPLLEVRSREAYNGEFFSFSVAPGSCGDTVAFYKAITVESMLDRYWLHLSNPHGSNTEAVLFPYATYMVCQA